MKRVEVSNLEEFKEATIGFFTKKYLNVAARMHPGNKLPEHVVRKTKIVVNAAMRGRIFQLLERNIQSERVFTLEENIQADRMLTDDESQMLAAHDKSFWTYAYYLAIGGEPIKGQDVDVMLEEYQEYVAQLRDKYNDLRD